MKPVTGSTVGQEQLCTWPLAGVVGALADWAAVPLDRGHELAVPGVYVFWGRRPENGTLSVYVGQTGAVSFRLRDHRKKQTWMRFAIMLYSQQSPLDQSLLRFLEVKLVQRVWRASEHAALRCETREDELPIGDEHFLGSERHAAAASLLSGCCELLCKLAAQVDDNDAGLVARCFAAPNT
jgi:hypothetical protein